MQSTSFESDNAQRTWQHLFSRHTEMLKNHLELWNAVKGQCSGDSIESDVANRCTAHTQEMMRELQQFSSTMRSSIEGKPLNDATKESARPSEASQSLAAKCIDDHETLSVRSSKRQRSEDQTHEPSYKSPTISERYGSNDPVSTQIVSQDGQVLARISTEYRPIKRMRQSEADCNGAPADLDKLADQVKRAQVHEQSSAGISNEHVVNNTETAPNSPSIWLGHNDPFFDKVSKKIREKEEKRKQKADKKRKRDSNASDESQYTQSHLKSPPKKTKLGYRDSKSPHHLDEQTQKTGWLGSKRVASTQRERDKRPRQT